MGGGIGMGNTCKPMAVSFQCMTKFTTNKKKFFFKKSLCLIFFSNKFKFYFKNFQKNLSIPVQGTKIPHGISCSQKKKKKCINHCSCILEYFHHNNKKMCSH